MRAVAVAVIGLTLSACTQVVQFRSDPPGARISVNGDFAGITPAIYEMPEHPLPNPIRYRVERGGYLPQEGELRPRFSVGRMFGALFTVGLVYAIKNPLLYRESYDFALAPVGDRDVEANPLRIDERLRRLQGLRDEGLITEEEYQRQRAAILHGL